MKTSVQNHLKVHFITFWMCVIQVNGASLTITQHPQYPNVSTSASLTCHIPSFTGGAEWLNNGLRLTQCMSSLCIPPSSARYQYSANATSMTVTIPSVDIALDDNTWICSHNSGTDTGDFNFTIYKFPSTLYINGIDSSILYEGDTVKLSVSTGCIHPSGSAYYIVIWKFVEATSAAENNFGTNITQNITSVGGCQYTYEDNLMFNLFLTNDMNTSNTTISISQVKMTFTMAGINFYATKSVAYNVTSNGTAAPATSQTQFIQETKINLNHKLSINERQQPLPPVDTGVENAPKFHPQSPPSQNGEIKDRNLRRISATIDDTPGLANETPRHNKLHPLTAKQETVQKENASEEPKKKGKEKKKKNQMNEEIPGDEMVRPF